MLITKLFIVSSFFVYAQVTLPQFENTDIGAKPISLGGAFTSLANNSSAVYYNPSGISQMSFREISIFYSPAPYGIKELSYGAFTYVEPTKFGWIGLSAKAYGFELYREITATLTYSNNYRKKIYYGANLNYYNLKIKNYGSAFTLGFDAGLLAYLTEYLRWGFSAMNLNRAKIGQSKEKLPQVYRTGLSLQVRKDLNLIMDAEKDTRYKVSIKAGMEYTMYDLVDIRAGVGSEPIRFSGGIGFFYSLFQLDYAFYNHQDLGLTHQASLTINFGGKESRRLMRESLSSAFEDKEIDTNENKTKIKKLKPGETVN
ncbi:MAG: hypothetical protein ACRDFC_08400, partial [Ignavibacteria bacterium]